MAEDKLLISGILGLDGEYTCDLAELLNVGNPGSLTAREGHRIKTMTGIRAGELGDAFTAGDYDVVVAIAAIVLTRHGKIYDEASLWDAPMGYVTFDVADRAEDDADPPEAKPPPVEQSTNGGGSSTSDSDSPASRPSLTGVPDWPMSATSDRPTLVT